MPRPGEGRLWGGNGSAVPLPFLPMGVGAPVMDIGYQIFPSLSMSKAVKKKGISTRDCLYVPKPPPDTVSIAAEAGRKRTRAVSGARPRSQAAFSIFSMKMPYPLVGSFSKTWVTAPTSFPFCRIGLPLMSDVNKGQKLF